MSTVNQQHGIILFDGVCNVCNTYVQFVIKRDPKGYFKFASLQSAEGQALLAKHNMPDDLDSIVLVEGDKVYTHSAAPLRVARKLHRLWPLCYGFIIVPAFIRDAVYKWVARNRYRWFGKKESCMMPTPDIRARFLE